MEIGGYLELENNIQPMLHDKAIALNCARNCLAYLIETKEIRKIAVPDFLCDSVYNVCLHYGVAISLYSVGMDFYPNQLKVSEDTWIYLVNYYGQISEQYIISLKQSHDRLIVDNVQAYFQMPAPGVDTIYTCRKFFGVPDGAFLYSDAPLNRELEYEMVGNRMEHILGRYEGSASEYYGAYVSAEKQFNDSPILKMSHISANLLHGIDYQRVKETREHNFEMLSEAFSKINGIAVHTTPGPFMYPLFLKDGERVRKKLVSEKIYIPVLWPDVYQRCQSDSTAVLLAKNILPLPVDQRYDEKVMYRLIDVILAEISGK